MSFLSLRVEEQAVPGDGRSSSSAAFHYDARCWCISMFQCVHQYVVNLWAWVSAPHVPWTQRVLQVPYQTRPRVASDLRLPEQAVTGHQEGSWGLTSPSRRASQKLQVPSSEKGLNMHGQPKSVARDAQDKNNDFATKNRVARRWPAEGKHQKTQHTQHTQHPAHQKQNGRGWFLRSSFCGLSRLNALLNGTAISDPSLFPPSRPQKISSPLLPVSIFMLQLFRYSIDFPRLWRTIFCNPEDPDALGDDSSFFAVTQQQWRACVRRMLRCKLACTSPSSFLDPRLASGAFAVAKGRRS